ncbi:MAG TPA: carbonic anhydrase family protein [Candidatus Dormibacteraeota bacterium]|nr:carbonic anhydrase family protein [Candidatus Dormibacteraeota bacterium]
MKSLLHRFSLAGMALLVLSGCQCPEHGRSSSPAAAISAAPPTKESQAATTPQQALAELRNGNARFVSGHPVQRDMRADLKATAGGQYPFAVVLSCVDSRQPTEIVFDQGVGDIFAARVAGNVLSEDIIGSMEFGCKVSGAKLLAVIGHSNCGAIKGSVDNVDLANLTGLLAKIKPAIANVPAEIQPRNSKNLAFVDKVSEANVRLVMQQIRDRSPILREMLEQNQIALVGGMYDLSTGEIHFFEK